MQDTDNRISENNESGVSSKHTVTSPGIIPAYQIYLENRRRKETVLFTKIGIVLVILFGISVTLASGILPVPFLNSFSEETRYAQPGDIPCPIGDKALDPKKIKVSVLNGTDINKLATKTGKSLKALEFQIDTLSNADNSDYETPALILTSPQMIDQAYTVALAFPDAQVKLGTSNGIKVILGKGFKAPIAKKDFSELLKKSLESPKSCLPIK